MLGQVYFNEIVFDGLKAFDPLDKTQSESSTFPSFDIKVERPRLEVDIEKNLII
jgi:hypothetical protein